MIHGDLKGVRLQQLVVSTLLSFSIKANILVDKGHNARLADFGLLTIMSDPKSSLSSTFSRQGAGSVRWMSPELIDPMRFGLKRCRPTKASDCYALGMVVYETISGHLPFHEVPIGTSVFSNVLNGERPPREACFTDTLWSMLEVCWEHQPVDRPEIKDVLKCLATEPPPPLPDVEMEEVGDDSDLWTESECKFSCFVSPTRPHDLRYRVHRGTPIGPQP